MAERAESGVSRRKFLIGSATASAAGLGGLVVSRLRRPPPPSAPRSAPAVNVDVVVAGGSIAAVAAAVELQRSGLTVAVLAPVDHVGGMTTAGISVTDIGDPATVGGFARQLYVDIGARYGLDHAYSFTPDVAQTVIDGYLDRRGVTVVRSAPITQLRRSGDGWEATTAGGGAYRSRYVVDATYEGDLLALAGVGYRLGREGRAEFAEADAGVRAPSHGDAATSPYRSAADPTSGLLDGVEPAVAAASYGDGDGRVTAACFRLTVTQGSRRVLWTAPAGYDPAAYEITARVAAAGGNPLRNIHPIVPGGAGDADLNNYQMGSTDLLAQGGRAWIDADHARRAQLFEDYRDWTQGLLYFLATDVRVPGPIRQAANRWGLDSDQFAATGGWSPLLYVREGRRLIGQVTLTEHEVLGQRPVADPVALASYPMDCHGHRYLVDSQGRLAVEGDMSIQHPPVGIPLGALIPARGGPGLVSAVGISATHVAWCAVRTEPVLAMIGQAAAVVVATAAGLGVAPCEVPYPPVRDTLLARGAVLAVDQRPAM